MSDISFFDFEVHWEAEPKMHKGRATFRFYGTTADRDRVTASIEELGFIVGSIQRFDAMSADDVAAHIKKELGPLAIITQRSPLRDVPEMEEPTP